MVSRTSPRAALTVAAIALGLLSFPATAQWMWKDEAGHTMASDQPPPAGTPASRILKEPRPRPGKAAPAVVAVDKDAAATADAGKSLADRELDAKQKQKDAADAQKKADDDNTRAIAMKDNCTAMRGNVAALQAGGRAARFNEKGEKVYIDDADRQNEIARQQAQVSQYCK